MFRRKSAMHLVSQRNPRLLASRSSPQEAYAGLVPEEYLQRVGEKEREARWGERILVRLQ